MLIHMHTPQPTHIQRAMTYNSGDTVSETLALNGMYKFHYYQEERNEVSIRSIMKLFMLHYKFHPLDVPVALSDQIGNCLDISIQY